MYHCLWFGANSLAGSEAWRLDLLHSFNSSLVEQRKDLLAPVPLRRLPFFLFSQSNSLSHLTLLIFSSLSFICFFLAISPSLHFGSSSPQMPIFLRLPVFSLVPTQTPFLPPSFSFALCVRVCRWLLLAGSVTRGNWGRVHFSRTNGNKLIHFHCCFLEAVWVEGKRTESCEF